MRGQSTLVSVLEDVVNKVSVKSLRPVVIDTQQKQRGGVQSYTEITEGSW